MSRDHEPIDHEASEIIHPSRLTGVSRRKGGLRRWLLLTFLLLLAAPFLLLPTPQASADVVLFTHGGTLRVTSWEVDGERIRLELAQGGHLEMSLRKVERILDEPEKKPSAPPAPPPFPLRFDATHPPPDTPYSELIFATAKRHGLNPALVAAVARAESAFDPRAVSIKGARGLMQLMPATGERFGLGEASVFEPAANLDAGVRYLRWLADRFDDRLAWVLAAYNAGEGSVQRYGGVPPYRETRRYLERIYATLGLPPSSDEATSAP